MSNKKKAMWKRFIVLLNVAVWNPNIVKIGGTPLLLTNNFQLPTLLIPFSIVILIEYSNEPKLFRQQEVTSVFLKKEISLEVIVVLEFEWTWQLISYSMH